MNFLDYIAYVPRLKDAPKDEAAPRAKINLVTNFTDDILKNVLAGVCLHHGVRPDILSMPYKQYHVQFKNPASELYAHAPDVSFLFFAATPFKESEFRSRVHFEELLSDIERYAEKISGTVVLTGFTTSYHGAYGNLFREGPQFQLLEEYNRDLRALAARLPNAIWFDADRLVHLMGEAHVFDLRALYAFDVPFTHEFMARLAEEWFALFRALRGGAKKALILDLDNTLWGGVVGELGPLGIALGPDYPGNAFVNFQRALLDFYERGILLAINSKNNLDDVMEVFEKNPHMILKEKHFAAIRANWDDKAANILSIAEELNIGTDSMVFLDDNPVERFAVQSQLPEIAVPDFSLPPEEYARTLYGLDWFHQLSLTDEDRQKGRMYAEERQRKSVQSAAKDVTQYIAELQIEIAVQMNAENILPRLSQLTQKTNQFNLATKRYAEHDIQALIEDGALAFSGEVKDRFGEYGNRQSLPKNLISRGVAIFLRSISRHRETRSVAGNPTPEMRDSLVKIKTVSPEEATSMLFAKDRPYRSASSMTSFLKRSS
jgi:FkbH-like protein